MVYCKEYTLTQQTPMIHFQGTEPGATLRATEVKPKLDRFIRNRCNNVPTEWIISKEHSNALNYKLQITANGNLSNRNPVYKLDRNNKPRGIGCYFFTETDLNKIKPSSFYSDIKLKIVCFIPKLFDAINNAICEFFATTNFGFRQNKGFGSFIVKEKERESAGFAGEYGYYLVSNNQSPEAALECIKNFYQVVKNGMNYPYDNNPIYKRSFLMKHYFSGHLNDKKAMKLALINAGVLLLESNGSGISYYDDDSKIQATKIRLTKTIQPITDAEYIRGLLGFAGFYTFRDVCLASDPTIKFDVTFEVNGGDIERFPSPILFKPIRMENSFKIFLIPDNESLELINGKKVTLHCKKVKRKDVKNYRDYPNIDQIVSNINNAISKVEDVQLTVKVPNNFLNDFLSQAVLANRYGLKRTEQ